MRYQQVSVMANHGTKSAVKQWTTEHETLEELLDEIAGSINMHKCTSINIYIKEVDQNGRPIF